MRFHGFFLALMAAFALRVHGETLPAIEDVRRLYNLDPVSTNNPVLVNVAECGIEIPVSEFAAFVRTDTRHGAEGMPLSPSEKRRELEKLINDYFWVWEGYAKKADQTPDIAGLLAVTKNEAMKTLLLKDEADSKANSFEQYETLKKAFEQRVFDRAEIHISIGNYEVLKLASKRMNDADAAKLKTTNTNATDAAVEDGLSADQRNLVLATCKIGSVRLGDLLRAYQNIPYEKRPDLQQRAVLILILREMWTDPLLIAEAEARGFDKNEIVRTQVQSDRTGLVREWALGEATQKAAAQMNDPGLPARLKEWYQANLTNLYTLKFKGGKERVLGFETNQAAIQNDYFDHLMEQGRAEALQKLRAGKKIVINEALLEKTPVYWYLPSPKNILRKVDGAWNGEMREYTVKPGETNASFVFCLTNISSGGLVIEEVHPQNEFVTAETPQLPWMLHEGERGEIRVTADLRHKTGVGYWPIEVTSSKGDTTLTLHVSYPEKTVDTTSSSNTTGSKRD